MITTKSGKKGKDEIIFNTGVSFDKISIFPKMQNEYTQPVYAPQEKIYIDLLKELKEASEQLVLSEQVFIAGDNIYDGDAGH